MKKLKFMLVFFIAICLLFVTGCGKDNKEDLKEAAGTYIGEYTKYVGDSDDYKVTNEDFSLELKEDGTGKHNRDGYSFDVTWELNGEKFTMSETFIGDPIEYTGALKDGKLDIFNGNPENDITLELVYTIKK